MRYCVFSDIHSNLEAFEAVLDFAGKSRIDAYLFVGDIVGYGADPCKCISLLKDINPLQVAGNHDRAATGLLGLEYFTQSARQAIEWTRNTLDMAELSFLSGLGFVSENDKFCLVHGTLESPREFNYMLDIQSASQTFSILKQQICFVGHSHVPGVFINDKGVITYDEPEQVEIKEGLSYIINDGSVGQPRNGDARASFCIFDDEDAIVEYKRLPYDVATAQKKIIKSGMPKVLADRLAVGR